MVLLHDHGLLLERWRCRCAASHFCRWRFDRFVAHANVAPAHPHIAHAVWPTNRLWCQQYAVYGGPLGQAALQIKVQKYIGKSQYANRNQQTAKMISTVIGYTASPIYFLLVGCISCFSNVHLACPVQFRSVRCISVSPMYFTLLQCPTSGTVASVDP